MIALIGGLIKNHSNWKIKINKINKKSNSKVRTHKKMETFMMALGRRELIKTMYNNG